VKIGVVTFPGSNCDYDCYKAVEEQLDAEAVYLWHAEHDLRGGGRGFPPGGFSYGDYLRAGAIAARSPIMAEVRAFAEGGGPVAGICNGFQILCEAEMLPGALIRNRSLKFRSHAVHLRVERADTPFTSEYREGEILRVPHRPRRGVLLRGGGDAGAGGGRRAGRLPLSAPDGTIDAEANPNGAARNIAGIVNQRGNVLGMMPHPERAVDALLGSTDGLGLFRSLAAHLARA
jgi:phosphoribosylformylglycinamidine synthase